MSSARASTDARPDDDAEDVGGDDWVIATWHVYNHAELQFVNSIDGRPAPDWNPSSQIYQAYKWRSYHAARKFQRAHDDLAGYVIVNLSEIKRQCDTQSEFKRNAVQS